MEKDRNDIIRENIEKAISDAKLSKLKVADSAQISYQNLTRFLKNNRGGSIGIDILQRLSIVLNVPISFFLGDADTHGDIKLTSKGIQLPEKWDELMKEIFNMPLAEQDKFFEMIAVILKNYKR